MRGGGASLPPAMGRMLGSSAGGRAPATYRWLSTFQSSVLSAPDHLCALKVLQALQLHAMESPIRLHCCKIPTDGFTPEHHCSPNLSVHTCVQTPRRTTEPSSLTQGSESSTPGAGTAPCIHLIHPVRRCLQSRPHNKHFGSSQSTAGASQPALTEPRAAGAAGRRGTTHKLEEKDDK